MSKFIDQLTENEFFAYMKQNPILMSEYSKLQSDSKFHIFMRDDMQITASYYDTKLTFTDFSVKTNKKIYLIPHYEKSWLRFMYEKFGEEYKKAFISYREDLKKKTNESFVFLTEECVNDMQLVENSGVRNTKRKDVKNLHTQFRPESQGLKSRSPIEDEMY